MPWLSDIIDIFFPKISLWDQTQGEYLSKNDKKTLKSHPEMCPASHFHSTDFKTLPPYRKDFVCEWVHIGFIYTEYLKKLIIKLKYDHRYDIATFLAQRLRLSIQSNQTLMKHIKKYPTYITHVPSHRRRKRFFRWYNQSEMLARSLAKELDLMHTDIYHKKRHTSSQTKLKRAQRLKNLQWVFVLKDKNIPINACIIIVDDIITTGSTLNQLAKTAKKQLPKSHIWWAVLGRHHW